MKPHHIKNIKILAGLTHPNNIIRPTYEHVRLAEDRCFKHPNTLLKKRIRWVNTLRKIVGRRMPKNKVGQPIIGDVDLLLATKEERVEAILRTYDLWGDPYEEDQMKMDRAKDDAREGGEG